MWTVWDKQSDINGFSADWFLNRHEYLKSEETIFIKTVDGRITTVVGKNTIATIYGIDVNLPNDAFIAEFERIISEPTEAVEET